VVYEAHRGAARQPLTGYARREPEKSSLYRIVLGHLPAMLAEAPARGIVISGAALSGNSFVVAKLLADDSPDTGFADGGVLETDLELGTNRYSGARGHTIDPDGRILVTGPLGRAWSS
jgi:hypothetical protein